MSKKINLDLDEEIKRSPCFLSQEADSINTDDVEVKDVFSKNEVTNSLKQFNDSISEQREEIERNELDFAMKVSKLVLETGFEHRISSNFKPNMERQVIEVELQYEKTDIPLTDERRRFLEKILKEYEDNL